MSAGKIKFLILKYVYVTGKEEAQVKWVTIRSSRMIQTDGSRQMVSDV